MDRVFRKMLRRVPRNHPVKTVLLLGLGAGGGTNEVYSRFPDAHITAVEHDPKMVEVCKAFTLQKKYSHLLKIIVDDAESAVRKMEKTYDLILVDLFEGEKLASILTSDDFIGILAARLRTRGYLAINFFRSEQISGPQFDRVFSRWHTLRHLSGTMALYRHFGNGKAGDPMPEGFVDHWQSHAFLKTNVRRIRNLEVVGTPGALGLRSKVGPFRIERYICEAEPTLEDVPYLRVINWQPLTVTEWPGWFHDPIPEKHSRIGVTVFSDGEYWRKWPRHARRHRERWLRFEPYEIVDIEFDDFVIGYHASKKRDRMSRNMWLRILRRNVDRQADQVHFFGARDRTTGEIVAGLAVVDYLDIRQCIHLVSFIHPNAESTSVGTGLIDHSFKHGLALGIHYMNFGVFWQEGDPESWKAYSNFKTQFNPYFLIYPPSLYKFIWPKKSS